MRFVCGAAIVLTLSACSLPTSDPNAESLARTAFEQLRAGDYPALIAEVSKEDWGPNPQPMLERMHALLPAGDPQPGRLVGFNSFAGTGGSTLTLNYQYDYPDGKVISSTVLAKDDKQPKGWIIRGFHINIGSPDTPPPQSAQPAPPARPAPKPQRT
ncbi:MAG TPA: hypothetical protein VFN88_06535 [Caulobacteraceae bacterium]|nr:hypothetical protein [Caulobacteraceae bacterium]